MRTVLFSALLFFALSSSAQTEVKEAQHGTKGNVLLSKSEHTVPASVTNTVPASGERLSETSPTPEQQGYTKQIINGKEVYVKQSGQMIIHYEPKKQ